MTETDSARDLGSLVVPAAGALVATGDLWEPYYLSGPAGGRVVPVSEFLRDLQATGRPATTQRSYSLALLRWFRFIIWTNGFRQITSKLARSSRRRTASPQWWSEARSRLSMTAGCGT
jgi:hypothetical protein